MAKQLENQVEKLVDFLKIICTINSKLKKTVRKLYEKSKIAIRYLNDFEINNKALQKYYCLMIKRSAVKC